MFETAKRIRIQGSPARLFHILNRPALWPVWDVDLTDVKLDAPRDPAASLEGATGKLTMKNGRAFDFTIRNVIENKRVEYLTKLPGIPPTAYFSLVDLRVLPLGADADWYWAFDKAPDNPNALDLEMGVRITGAASMLWRMVFAPFLPAAFDACTHNLKTLVEENKVNGKDYTDAFK
ncbi:hypothetical protein HDU83_000101 [Entophlyctis luteolus]|nr:hypothetical protein HDU83_000101 [Entophlyctis luteolus]